MPNISVRDEYAPQFGRQGDDVVSLEPLPLGRQVMVIVP